MSVELRRPQPRFGRHGEGRYVRDKSPWGRHQKQNARPPRPGILLSIQVLQFEVLGTSLELDAINFEDISND